MCSYITEWVHSRGHVNTIMHAIGENYKSENNFIL
jgi:hypothetical protein